MDSLKQACTYTLSQLRALISELQPEQYAKELEVFNGNTVGKHVRHVIEFYQCLYKNVDSGNINYDKRERNIFLENDPALAVSEINSIINLLDQKSEDISLNLQVTYDWDASEVHSIPSSLYREIAYNLEHTVHHMAIIRIGIESFIPEFYFPEDFGVARSTIRNQKEQTRKVKTAS